MLVDIERLTLPGGGLLNSWQYTFIDAQSVIVLCFLGRFLTFPLFRAVEYFFNSCFPVPTCCSYPMSIIFPSTSTKSLYCKFTFSNGNKIEVYYTYGIEGYFCILYYRNKLFLKNPTNEITIYVTACTSASNVRIKLFVAFSEGAKKKKNQQWPNSPNFPASTSSSSGLEKKQQKQKNASKLDQYPVVHRYTQHRGRCISRTRRSSNYHLLFSAASR